MLIAIFIMLMVTNTMLALVILQLGKLIEVTIGNDRPDVDIDIPDRDRTW